jgi:hypothetical protein
LELVAGRAHGPARGNVIDDMARDAVRLPPTSPDLTDDGARPYFVWWTDVTVGEVRRLLQDTEVERRAYWLGALLREANTRDVWLFTTPEDVRRLWPHLVRHLGQSRERWAWLLDIDDRGWPPAGAKVG